MDSNTDVAVIKCGDYIRDNVKKAIEIIIDLLGGAQSFVKNGDKVLLKPNMFRPSTTGTTHPAVVQAVAECFMDAGAKIYLTDSPMTHSIDDVARSNGITEVCNNLGIKMIHAGSITKIMVNNPKCSKMFFLPALLEDMDLIINLPKIKAHPLTVLSGSVKNMFGLCPGLTKSQFHLRFKRKDDFCQMLLDLYSIVKPGLTIMDAIDGTDNSGNVRRVGVIIGSRDGIALDATACRIIGIPPELVLTTAYGADRKLGVMETENIHILGDILNYPLINDFEYVINHPEVLSSISISAFDSFFPRNIISKPLITKKCEKCGLCAKVCPKNAIIMESKTAQIDYSKCIRCYCCQEICPNQAVLIKEANPAFRQFTDYVQNIVFILRSLESKKGKSKRNI